MAIFRPMLATNRMFRLLSLRVSALLLRPLVILLEGLIVSDGHVLVFAMPIAMMALTISSIPVHRAYYQSHEPVGLQALHYASGLGTIMLVGFAILVTIFHLPGLAMSAVLIGATAFMFLIEKLADEVSRMLEFRKNFFNWFLTQLLRSGWLLIPIAACLAGLDYQLSFLVASVLSTFVFLLVFYRVTGLVPSIATTGLRVIRENLVFLSGASLTASQRQVPRILVARLSPEFAHIYLAMAQVAQGVALIFNVRYQIPYRKIIARKTALFQKLKHRLMVRILIPPAIIAPIYILAASYFPLSDVTPVQMAVILGPILVAEALASAILAAHLGYLTWFAERRAAFITYLLAAALPLSAYSIAQMLGLEAHLTILSVPGIATTVAIVWIAVIVRRHFRVPDREKLH